MLLVVSVAFGRYAAFAFERVRARKLLMLIRVLLALSFSPGHVLGFNVKPSRSVLRSASRCQPPISIHCDTVIYRLMSHVSTSVASLLPPAREYRVLGEANVAHIFSINVAGRKYRNVAGCRVVNGVVGRANKVRVLRGPERKVVYEGK